jgi:hypothetical protein
MLWDAIRKNSEHNVSVILGANFPVDQPLNAVGMNSLHLAACSSTREVLNIIMQYNPNVNARDSVSIVDDELLTHLVVWTYPLTYGCSQRKLRGNGVTAKLTRYHR